MEPQFQRSGFSCDAGHEWTGHPVVHAPVDMACAWMAAISCPECGSRKVFFGQTPKQIEVNESEPIAIRLARWQASSDTGSSSKDIAARMSGVTSPPGRLGWSYPWDAADLGRCLRLLRIIPEWKPRMAEMATCGPVWAALVARWDEMERSMDDEAGIFWEKAKRAPVTGALMRQIIDGAERVAAD